MFPEKAKKFPIYSMINIIVVGEPQEERDRILGNRSLWGQEVNIQYCSTPRSLVQMLKKETHFDIVIVDYTEMLSKWESYKKILSNLDLPIIFITNSKSLKTSEPLLIKDNIYQIPFSPKNTLHLKRSLRNILNYILQHRKYLLNLFDKSFDEYLMNMILDDQGHRLEERISYLLNLCSNSFNFEVAVLLSKKEGQGLRLFKNKETVNFCPLLPDKSEIHNICEDFLSNNIVDFPSEFLHNNIFQFNATKENSQALVRVLKNTEHCGLCHSIGYRSLIFCPFSTSDNIKWLLILADTKPDKATEDICRFLEEKKNVLSMVIAYLQQFSREKNILKLHQISLETAHIGVWEYEVDTGKIISSGLNTLFPFLRVPKEVTEWWEYIHPSDRIRFWQSIKPCIKGVTDNFAVDHRLVLPGNKLIWVRTIGKCVSREGKNAKRLLGIGMDITSFMESEQELKSVKENLQIASELGNVGLWSWDISKNIYAMNQSARDILGIKNPGPYTLENWLDCILPQYRELVREELGETFTKDSSIFNVQYQILYKGMYKRWIHTYGKVSARDTKGKPITFSGTHMDITERKELERQLTQEAVINSYYAGLARSLLKIHSVDEVTRMICQAGLDILNSQFCFAGYFNLKTNKFNIQGIDKNGKLIVSISLSMKELLKKENMLANCFSSGMPIMFNELKDKKFLLFEKIQIERLMCFPSYTPSNELVVIITANSENPYTPLHWESIEWLSSIYAQSLDRIWLEEKNIQKTKELEETVIKLQQAMKMVKKLHGLLPICARCKKIRDDAGYWQELEVYIREHTDAEFSHGICPECAKELYGDYM